MELQLTNEEQQRKQFLVELRRWNYERVAPEMASDLGRHFAHAGRGCHLAADAGARFAEYLEESRIARLWSETQRTGQEMMWQWATDVVERRREALLTPVAGAHGSLELAPALPMPKYYDGTDFHIQPGGYMGELNGFVYDTMVPLFYMGRMRVDHYARVLGERCRVDRQARILDLGAGTGHNTLPWAARFPEAEVHGIDLSPAMLHCAQRRAALNRAAIHWKQMNAEALEYPDRSFDVVSACLLFHELPEEAIRRVCREARRVLRRDGLFVIADHAPFDEATTPLQAFHRWWDTFYNGEPFVLDFVRLDLPVLLQEAGFTSTEQLLIEKPSGHAASAIARAVIARP